jgi:ABC-type transport system involved in cytochrome bd biosynthesis fused ATPase/permease subunit
VTVLLDLQMGVIKAVRNSVAADGEVAALWVTRRLEELKYTDGAIYMEDGQIISQGNVSTISRFIKKKQAKYFGNFEL